MESHDLQAGFSGGPLGRAQLFEVAEVIEAQPLEQRAAGFDQLAEELLRHLQSGDTETPR